MNFQSSIIKLLAALSFCVLSTSSYAALITSSDSNPFNFSWSYDRDGDGSYFLTGHGSLTISGFNSNQLVVDTTLFNTSPAGGQGGDRLTSFGFGIDPDATGVSFFDDLDGGLTNASFALGALPSNVAGVEICGWAGNNCAGGGNGGIYAGFSDSFSILLDGTWGDSVIIDPIGVRYQTGAGSYTFEVPTTEVPEPSVVALMGLGLIGLGFVRRRKQQA